MSLSRQSCINHSIYSKKVTLFLQRFKDESGLCSGDLADLSLTSARKIDAVLSGARGLPIVNFKLLMDKLNVGLNAILNDRVDFVAILSQFKGNKTFMPLRYSNSAFSRKRTLVNIFDFIKNTYGPAVKKAIMQEHQLTGEMFLNPNEEVSHSLMEDLFDYFESMRIPLEYLDQMGKNSYKCNKSTLLGKILSKERTPRKVYELVFDELANIYFDKNFEYEIQLLNEERCLMTMSPKPGVAEALSFKKIGSLQDNRVRSGVISTFSQYIGLSVSHVIASKRSECSGEVDFNINFPKINQI